MTLIPWSRLPAETKDGIRSGDPSVIERVNAWGRAWLRRSRNEIDCRAFEAVTDRLAELVANPTGQSWLHTIRSVPAFLRRIETGARVDLARQADAARRWVTERHGGDEPVVVPTADDGELVAWTLAAMRRLDPVEVISLLTRMFERRPFSAVVAELEARGFGSFSVPDVRRVFQRATRKLRRALRPFRAVYGG